MVSPLLYGKADGCNGHTKCGTLLGKDNGGIAGSEVYAMPPKSEVLARLKLGQISTITNITGSQPIPKQRLSVDEDTVRGTYEADRDELIEYVKKRDPGYFDDKGSASQKNLGCVAVCSETDGKLVVKAY